MKWRGHLAREQAGRAPPDVGCPPPLQARSGPVLSAAEGPAQPDPAAGSHKHSNPGAPRATASSHGRSLAEPVVRASNRPEPLGRLTPWSAAATRPLCLAPGGGPSRVVRGFSRPERPARIWPGAQPPEDMLLCIDRAPTGRKNDDPHPMADERLFRPFGARTLIEPLPGARAPGQILSALRAAPAHHAGCVSPRDLPLSSVYSHAKGSGPRLPRLLVYSSVRSQMDHRARSSSRYKDLKGPGANTHLSSQHTTL